MVFIKFFSSKYFDDNQEFDRILNLDTATEDGQSKIVKQYINY